MADEVGILVLGELTEKKEIDHITLEMLGIGRKLADELGKKLSVAVIGSDIDDFGGELIAFGADYVYIVDDPLFKQYQADSYTEALEKLSREVMPDIIFIGHTSIGQEVAPRLAFRLKTRLITDCVDLAIDPDSRLLLQTKMVYGGNALAIYASELKPQMATIRAKTMSPIERDDYRKGKTIRFDPRIDASSIRTEPIEKVKEEKKEINIEDANIVISGGRGIGSREGFSQLKELARLLNGAYGGSRPPCDQGWVPSSHQVGLTGKIIAPSLYMAVGISGATQHIVGISGAKKIVAINKDPNANIFRVADYGVIGDYREVLPSLIEKVREFVSE